MGGCLLCLQTNNEYVGNIKVNSTQWQELNIENLIEKHLWPVETIQLSSWLCSSCWQELYDFHKFYTHIEEAHMGSAPVTKIEFVNGINFEPEITMQDTVSPVLIIKEQKIIIKEEHDLWVHVAPSMQKTSKPRGRAATNADKTMFRDPLNTTKKFKQTKITKPKTKKKESITKSPREIPTDKQTEIKQEINEYDNGDSNDNPNKEFTPTNENKLSTKNYKTINQEKDNFIAENLKISCNICQIPIETFQSLRMHCKIEHDQAGYVECCNKKFFTRYLLLDHLHQHLDSNYLKCDQCDKVMSNLICLKYHKKTHEPEREKNHCCDVCGMSFLTRHILNTHKTRHLSEEEKLFPCSECAKKFGTKWTLKNHIRAVHVSTTSCDICGLLVANKSVLKRHKSLKHPVSEQQEHTCPICSKISPNIHAHEVHVKYVHQMGYNYKCTMCDKAFKRSRALKDHIATHTGAYLHTCTYCPKTFKASSNMKCHRKKCHPKEWEEMNRKKYVANFPNIVPPSTNIVNYHSISLKMQ